MLNFLLAVFKDEDGANIIEYAIIMAIISVAAIVALKSIGSTASGQLGNAGSNL
jgi:Flp pilus assembly pilin Flp